jgi:hypothetical protein
VRRLGGGVEHAVRFDDLDGGRRGGARVRRLGFGGGRLFDAAAPHGHLEMAERRRAGRDVGCEDVDDLAAGVGQIDLVADDGARHDRNQPRVGVPGDGPLLHLGIEIARVDAGGVGERVRARRRRGIDRSG